MKIVWCRTDPWLADPAAARRFCAQSGILTGDFLSEKDLVPYAAGRYLLLQGLRQCGQSVCLADLAVTPAGKPYFPDSPVRFSISHAGAVALCALSRAAVGADVEEVLPPDPSLLSALQPEERTYLEALPARCQASAFCRLWTRKESLLKARGGVLADILTQESVVTPEGSWRDRLDGFYLRRVPLPDGAYEAAVCTEAEGAGPLSPLCLELPPPSAPL